MDVCLHDVATTQKARLVELDPRGLAIFAREVALTELQFSKDLISFRNALTQQINDHYGTAEHHFSVEIFDHSAQEVVDEISPYGDAAHITLIVDAHSNGFHSFGVH